MEDNESEPPPQNPPKRFWLFTVLWRTNIEKRKEHTDGVTYTLIENNKNRVLEDHFLKNMFYDLSNLLKPYG